MNAFQRVALAAATAALGSGLALGGAPAANAASHATTATQASVHPSTSCGYYNGTALTKSGQTGSAASKRIKEVQCLININTSYPTWLTEDGKFGQKTYTAVVKVQEHAHISADGEVGPHTWAKLRAGVWW